MTVYLDTNMAPSISLGFYHGSELLQPLVGVLGLPLDQLNFLTSLFTAFVLGYWFRTCLRPSLYNPTTRHVAEASLGLGILYFCFGRQMLHMVAQTIACYWLMVVMPKHQMSLSVFVTAVGYLCVCHMCRQIYDYGGYTLDITGPLMINAQRLSSLAFAISDGRLDDKSKLSQEQKNLAIYVLEITSFAFSFHTVIIGPFCHYKEYINFIDGSNLKVKKTSTQNNSHTTISDTELDPGRAILYTVIIVLISGFITVKIAPLFPGSFMYGEEFANYSFLRKMFYLIIFTTITRPKYYFAWKFAESANLSSGLSFNGLTESGSQRWDLLDPVHIWSLEGSGSLKVLLDNWNIATVRWLRYSVYERLYSTTAVFTVSAFWHGFYPGYYLMFFSFAMATPAARLVRRKVRPYFQTSAGSSRFYDFLTFVATRFVLAYLTFPFILLEFWPSLKIYGQLNYSFHVLMFLVLVVFRFLPTPAASTSKPKTQ